MNEWIDELSDLTAAGEAAVIVTIAAVRGSAPREPGAKMIVTSTETIGTIGGGQLEHQCTHMAVNMLTAHELPSLRKFPLGAAMGQCCGGVVEVLFEPIDAGIPAWLKDLRALHGQRQPATLVTGIGESAGKYVVATGSSFGPDDLSEAIEAHARELAETRGSAERVDDYLLEPIAASDFNIAVFGAGHVGAALVGALSQLDCNIRWIDNRRNVFRQVPRNVRAIETESPALEVAAMPAGSFFLVMTQSHALDFEICTRILGRDDVAYSGLIGSRTKRRRFEKRFAKAGLSASRIDQLVCPIGVDGISGKKPAEIAVAVAAELLQVREGKASVSYPDNVLPIGG